jgi:SpoVK/Ycf46/Vps4 family AAA+-type ATPase
MRRDPGARVGALPKPSSKPQRLRALPAAREESSLLDLRAPCQSFSQLALPKETLELFAEVHLELEQEDYLAAHGTLPRRSFLLVGPPGTGKSATAEALADELGRELAVVSLASVMSSFLGETAKNLVAAVEAAAEEPWVLLIDEIDALGKERGDRTDHAELSRVVNAVLQILDRFVGQSVLVATSNYPELLDRALWRRFDEVISYEMPSVHEIRSLLRMRLRPIPRSKDIRVEKIASQCGGLSQADVSRVVTDAFRRQLLHAPSRKLSMADLEWATENAWRRRNSAIDLESASGRRRAKT